MTSQPSCTDVKRGRSHSGVPKVGTKIREIYDALRRGEVVKVGDYNTAITVGYGMAIKPVQEMGRRGKSGSILVGEWEGPYFRTLDQILQDDALGGVNQMEIT